MFKYILPKYFTLAALSEQSLDTARALCDKHVGVGLYSQKDLRSILVNENHCFYLICYKDRPIGYFYCFRSDNPGQLGSLWTAQVEALMAGQKKIGVFRSIGIDEEYRGYGLSDMLVDMFAQHLFQAGCAVILAPAWKKGDEVPARRHLEAHGFRILCELYRPWSTQTAMQCPHCGETPCSCDAVVYYLIELEGENSDETETEK